jgi:hypothetical protein
MNCAIVPLGIALVHLHAFEGGFRLMRQRSLVLVAMSLVVSSLSSCGGSASPTQPTVINFAGNYSGTYQVTSCNDGTLPGFCAGTGFNVGTQLPITMSLGQNGALVSGSVALGGITGGFQGTASGSALSGSAPLSTLILNGVQLLSSITSWSSTLNGNGMSGTFTVTFSIVSVGSNATMTASLVTLTRG